MPVFIHADYLDAIVAADSVAIGRAVEIADGLAYAEFITTEGMISEFLRRWSDRGPLLRDRAIELSRTLYLRRGTVQTVDFARFVTALDAYRSEFRDSALTLEDVIAVQLLRESDSTDILSSNTEFQRYGLRPLMA